MARLSRRHFPAYEDLKLANADSITRKDSSTYSEDLGPGSEEENEEKSNFEIAGINGEEYADRGPDVNHDGSELRRDSAVTDASISSMPDSLYPTDSEYAMPMHKPYASPGGRPTVRRPELFYRSTPRSRIQSRLRSRTATPTKAAKSKAEIVTKTVDQDEETQKKYPLILLHIDLLPIKWRWSEHVMRDTLPLQVRQDLQLLQSNVDCRTQERGILIRHPGCEYDLLEERLFEAIGLQNQRITADGHFVRPHTRTDQDIPELSCAEDSDSGLGSIADSSDSEPCSICEHRYHTEGTCVTAAGKKWSMKAFAANGLITASTWVACWEEMERIDIEILPWLSEELKQKLDLREEEEESYQHAEEESERIRILVEEHVKLALEEAAQLAKVERLRLEEQPIAVAIDIDAVEPQASQAIISDYGLPRVYNRSQIPLSVLLKNYVYLLAQDRRNVVIFVLFVSLTLMGISSLVGDHSQMNESGNVPEQVPQYRFGETRPSAGTFWVDIDGPASLTTPSASDVSTVRDAIASPSTTDCTAKSMFDGRLDWLEGDTSKGAHPQAVAQIFEDEGSGICYVPASLFEGSKLLWWPICTDDMMVS